MEFELLYPSTIEKILDWSNLLAVDRARMHCLYVRFLNKHLCIHAETALISWLCI